MTRSLGVAGCAAAAAVILWAAPSVFPTRDGAIVWEYGYPVFSAGGRGRPTNSVYRAYRVLYAWIPQLAKPSEQTVTPPKAEEFRVK